MLNQREREREFPPVVVAYPFYIIRLSHREIIISTSLTAQDLGYETRAMGSVLFNNYHPNRNILQHFFVVYLFFFFILKLRLYKKREL